MRPHRLTVTAFGPFAGTVAVDFDDLALGGVFLLQGETGAGKTTLLDALGFALYGRVPGERNAARRLRSDHGGAAGRTEVCLEATVGGRRLRITRSPEQARPKKRGDGVTSEPARVLLEEMTDGGWRTVSTRAGEADQEVADRLGMSADQFFQVILLPQGDFARFLRSGSDERAALLERLFGTARFRGVESWLAERRRATARAEEECRRRVLTLAEVVAEVAEAEPPEGVPEAVWATDLACQQAAAVESAGRAVAAAAAELAAASARAEATRALAARQRRRAAAAAREAELVAALPAVEALAAELAAAVRAAEVAPLLDALAVARSDLAAAGAADASARARAAACGAEDDAGPSALRASAGEWERRRGRLADLQEVADAAAAERAAAGQAGREGAALETRLDAARGRAAELAAARSRLAAARDAARAAAQALPAAGAEADRLAAAAALADELAAAEPAALRARAALADARETAQDLRDEAHRIRRERFDGMVAELAARLSDDAPCPVCGSIDHPDPSEVRADRVTHEQEEAAAAAAEAARAHAERLGAAAAAERRRVEDLTARLAALWAQGTGPAPAAEATLFDEPPHLPSRAELAAAASAAAARRDELAALAGRLAAHDAALAAADAEAAELEAERAAVAEQRAAARREEAAAQRRAAAREATLAARLDGAPDLPTALAAAAGGAAALAAAADAREELIRAEAACRAAAVRAGEAARAAGFPDPEGAGAAARPPAWRADATERTRVHGEELAAVRALLADPDLDVGPAPAADVAAAEALEAAAREAHERAVAAQGRARHRAGQLERRVPQLVAALAELGPLEAAAAEVRGLADLVAGQGANSRRMTLTSYVLAARLEEIAAVASERLLRMTQGRYALVHTDSGRGNRRAGLGLLVRDAWTGRDRETGTLSGGETFLASLALALGLADVVCAEAGGSRLEALFVDEGFGSLDPDTLDEVMDTLDGLREGGRVVGLVSHVTELRQRIPAQLHVLKTPAGSDVRRGCR